MKELFIKNNSNVLISTWKEANQNFLSALFVQKCVMTIILSIIILIAVSNVVSNLIVLIKSRQKDIAIMMTIGASDIFIKRLFLFVGMCIGFVGVCIGSIVGILFAKNIGWITKKLNILQAMHGELDGFDTIPSMIHYSDVMYVVFLSLILTFLSIAFPSKKASKLNPSSILRNL